MGQLNPVHFLVSQKFCNPAQPTTGWWLVGWLTYENLFFCNYFIYLLHYNENELTQFIFYNSGIKVFS